MIKGILGKKLGMSQLFKEDGEVLPVPLILTGACYVVQKKTVERDGYAALQVGFGAKKPGRVNKPDKGHQDKAGMGYFYYLREVACDDVAAVNEGDEVKAADIFSKGDKIKITGVSKGKGFQGVMRRHHFSGNPAAHGSLIHRSSGSVGSSADPSKVIKGKRMAGQMGNKQVTVKNIEVIDIREAEGIIAVKGAVPGSRGQLVILKKQEG